MARHPEYQYLDLLEHLLEKGDRRIDRTGVGTLSTFGAMMRFDLSDGSFPVYTTKRVFWKTAVKEMLWFLTGQTNIQSLLRENVGSGPTGRSTNIARQQAKTFRRRLSRSACSATMRLHRSGAISGLSTASNGGGG